MALDPLAVPISSPHGHVKSTGRECIMLEIISDLPDYVLGIKASGEVTAEDYRTVLIPAIESQLAKHHRVRLLYVMGDEFKGYTGGAAWEDTKVGMKHLMAFQRVAVVTDVDAIRTMVKAAGFAIPGEVRVYENSQLSAAREWISEAPDTGKLSFRLDGERGVLVLEPRGELRAADFDRLTAQVDPFLQANGELNGVAVVAEHFPGWEDLAAVGSHLRFVRDHHKKVRRVALITNDRLASAVPKFARLFVSAEVLVFPVAEREQALSWVGAK